MNSINTYTLQEIADWQLNSKNSKVELPIIQRGFVWKPQQIEDLWDSLLRGYPIGSFLLSKIGDNLYLMDGQQRATSIFLGFFDPFKHNNTQKAWSIKEQLPVVWIDIKPNETPDTSKYLIRVSTHSHPWGYQARYNNKKLDIRDRSDALGLFKRHPENKGGYTSFKNTTVFPFDCCYPLPLSFLIESKNINNVIDLVNQYFPEYFSTKDGNFSNKADFITLLNGERKDNLTDTWKVVQQVKDTHIISNIIDEKILNDESTTENPTLFVRMNSSGTTLTNDDLIYSIYKATFPESKKLIESIGINFISPTQVLSIVTRIVDADLNGEKYTKKLNVRDFQRKIKNDSFRNNLQDIIQNNYAKDLFNQAIEILSCKENSLFKGQMPPVIIKQFIKDKQEIFLFFMYWLHIHNDINGKLTDKIKLKMVGKLYSFAWFNFENIQRLWNEKISNDNFWEEPLNELIWWDGKDGIHFLIEPNLLREYYQQPKIETMFKESDNARWGLWVDGIGENIKQYFSTVKSDELDLKEEIANEYFWRFIERIQHNKQLILFAQRDYINSAFEDYNQMDNIEDTNVPWDWDHIYPSEWVYRKQGCNQTIRDWNNTNGNFRAISLEHNRSRGNSQPPNDITDFDEQEYSFIKKNDWKYWQNIDVRISNDQIQNYFQAVTTRMLNIYEKFWDDLMIKDLIEINKE